MKIKPTTSATTSNNPVPFAEFTDPEAYFNNPSSFERVTSACPTEVIDISGDSHRTTNDSSSNNHQLRPGGFESNASSINSLNTVKTPFDDMNENWVNLLGGEDQVEEWKMSSSSAAAGATGSNQHLSGPNTIRRAPPLPPTATANSNIATRQGPPLIAGTTGNNKPTAAGGGVPPPIPPRPTIARRPTSSSSSSSRPPMATSPPVTAAASSPPPPQQQQQQVLGNNRLPAFMTVGGQSSVTSSAAGSAAAAIPPPRPMAAQSSAATFFNNTNRTNDGGAASTANMLMMNPPSTNKTSSNPPLGYPSIVSPFQSMMLSNNINHGGFPMGSPPPQRYPSVQGAFSSATNSSFGAAVRPPPFNPSYNPDASHRKTGGWVDVDEVDPYRQQDMNSEYSRRKQREAEDARYARKLQEEEESTIDARYFQDDQERLSLQKAIELMEEENRQKQMEDELHMKRLRQQLEEELAEEEARRIAMELEGAEMARMIAAQEQMAYEEQRRLEEEGLKVAMALQKEEEEAEERRLKQIEEERLRRQREAEAMEAERKRQIWMATPDARFAGKRCPNCRQVIFKDVGCDNVKCVCGKTFNYGTATVISDLPPPEPVPAPNSGISPSQSSASVPPNQPTSAGEPRRRSSRTFGSLFRRSSSQQPEQTIPIARPGLGQQQQQHDDTDCGAARAPAGPRPAFLDDFLRSTDGTAARGSYECFMCNDNQSDVFFHCCKGIMCMQCTKKWLQENQNCPKCRAQLTRPPEKLVLN